TTGSTRSSNVSFCFAPWSGHSLGDGRATAFDRTEPIVKRRVAAYEPSAVAIHQRRDRPNQLGGPKSVHLFTAVTAVPAESKVAAIVANGRCPAVRVAGCMAV